MEEQIITVSLEVFRNESELRQVIDLFEPRFMGSASNVGEYSKDFIRETWDRINWKEIFGYWYIHKSQTGQSFSKFMKTIDPKEEFYKEE